MRASGWTNLRRTGYATALAMFAFGLFFCLVQAHHAMAPYADARAGQVGLDGVLSPDGRQIALLMDDGSVEIRALDGQSFGLVRGHSDRVVSVEFTPDNQSLVTVDAGGVARRTNLVGLSFREDTHLSNTTAALKTIGWDGLLSAPAKMAASLQWGAIPGTDARKIMEPTVPAPILPEGVTPGVGTMFRDCDVCPDMVVVPSGSFMMGAPEDEVGRSADEGPQRNVEIEEPIAVGRFELTFEQWEACVLAGGCDGSGPEGEGGAEDWGRGNHPVINVGWVDAQSYVSWLSGETGETYRLLSEAEWEYVARARSTGRYSWGNDDPTCSRGASNGANFGSCSNDRTEPVGYSAPNAFGLHDVHGNVWEWVEDCYVDSYSGAPTDGSARVESDCSRRVLRGGSWYATPQNLRSADRLRNFPALRIDNIGFRVARRL